MTLTPDLQKLIEHACTTTWSQFDWVKANASLYGLTTRTTDKWTTPAEPAFVSLLAQYPFLRRRLAKIIQAHASPALALDTPLVSGVFVHDKPKVRFGASPTQVDLGDLLFVRHHYRTGHARPEGRAFLLQAKASTTPRTGALTGKAGRQFDLYADWSTPFAFPNGEFGPPPAGGKWDFSQGPASHRLSGVYGIVSSQRSCRGQKFPDNCPWAVGAALAPDKGLPRDAKASMSLAAALDGFIAGRHGRPWHVGADAHDHWSTFVEQVLRRSIAWDLQVQRIGGVDLPRKRAALSFIQSFLSLEVNAKLMLSPVDRELSFEGYVEDLIATVDSVGRQAKAWAASIDGDDEPSEVPVPQDGPQGGMSVVYVATFGDGPLAEAEPDWVPAPEPRQPD
ncbi:MAG: hypothetical protein ABIR54_09640 [Burkholderiaceae bacterium]